MTPFITSILVKVLGGALLATIAFWLCRLYGVVPEVQAPLLVVATITGIALTKITPRG
ncbi:MAG: hypothetical protein UY96_C0017G0019 [Parcubacteria group bacterium GW2011_GWB1_56_8]|nr:MAG: hypothetical protein UY96_C0017G0019 [Parcubacteria group bacterium GW2011_GWB1_56_8]